MRRPSGVVRVHTVPSVATKGVVTPAHCGGRPARGEGILDLSAASPRVPVNAKRPALLGHRRVARAMGILFGLSVVIPLAAMQPAAVAAGGSCTGWQSTTVPPETVRVYRTQTGVVEVVPFQTYVVTVMGKEWPGYLPMPVIEAGAVAVKQYAWFYAMEGRHRSSYVNGLGECFDVRDSTTDQLYKPEKARVVSKHWDAMFETWEFSLRKDHKQFLTGYRRGDKGPCASDATGWKLYAQTAISCAEDLGYNWDQILRAYYSPDLLMIRSDGSIVDGDGQAIGDATVLGSALTADDPPEYFDERHDAIEWNGDWGRSRSANAYRKTLTVSSDLEASAVFRFQGRTLAIIGRRAPNRGRLRIFVNGNLKETVDLWAAEKQNQATLFTRTYAQDSIRTVRLEVAGPVERARVEIDAIVVSR